MAERKQVTVHYRKFDSSDLGGATLESAFRNAMNESIQGSIFANNYKLRVWRNADDNLFVNYYSNKNENGSSYVFGDLIHFTAGHLQALFDKQNEAPTASVYQMPAPSQKEYIHSLMYWLIKDDHVFVIQSQSLKTEAIENYLTWFLKGKGDLDCQDFISTIPQVVLQSKFDFGENGGDLDDVKQIVIGGVAPASFFTEEVNSVVPAPVIRETVTEVTADQNSSFKASAGWTQALDILQALLGSKANVEKMMQAIPEDTELSVQVHIGYKTKKRKVSREALKDLEVGLRNIPDSELSVFAKSGKLGKDGNVRLHHNASIKLLKVNSGESQIIGSLLDPSDVERAMVQAYNVLLGDGKIE